MLDARRPGSGGDDDVLSFYLASGRFHSRRPPEDGVDTLHTRCDDDRATALRVHAGPTPGATRLSVRFVRPGSRLTLPKRPPARGRARRLLRGVRQAWPRGRTPRR